MYTYSGQRLSSFCLEVHMRADMLLEMGCANAKSVACQSQLKGLSLKPLSEILGPAHPVPLTVQSPHHYSRGLLLLQ